MEQTLYCYWVSTQHVFPNSLVTYLAHSSWALLSFQNDLGARENIYNSRRQNTASLPSWHLYEPRWIKRQIYGWAGDSHGNIYRTSASSSITKPEIKSAWVRVLSVPEPKLFFPSIWVWREQEERTLWPGKALTAELLHFAWYVSTHWPLDCT